MLRQAFVGALRGDVDVLGTLEKRDIEALAKEVGQWNEMLAAFAGQLQDALEKTGQPEGLSLEAPILEFPDFEHLEAEGRNPKKTA